ncbi:hypothetical protein MTBBW1_1860028 [Desulfamplus magnetovallimortis]|uniref:Uncharacterized protein n=1 Tax=Desulfamplus magnetovallimortis TaxID=1246637 RepID=A0A1W1HAY5_9BACT|nr:hypothetical protein MTBBW1_1860028 [Desulfamplus magnetovallimortis]
MAATQAQGLAEATTVDGSVGCEAVGQPDKQLTVHLGIARQTEPAEQIVRVVDGAVMGADDDAGADDCCGCWIHFPGCASGCGP